MLSGQVRGGGAAGGRHATAPVACGVGRWARVRRPLAAAQLVGRPLTLHTTLPAGTHTFKDLD
eukprot:5522316-Prymnesium_polylepis.2